MAVPQETRNPGQAFNYLTDLVRNGDLVFPDQVMDELERLALDEDPHVWARAVAGERFRKAADYSQVQWVLNQVRDLTDSEAEYEVAAPYVVALARELIEDGHNCHIVTDDVHDKPTRIALTTACMRLGIRSVTCRVCLSEAGRADLLS